MNSRKKKILFIVSNLKIGGGAERVVALISNEISKNHDVRVLTFYNFKNEYKTNFKRINLNFNYTQNSFVKIFRLMFIIPFYINSYLNKHTFDIVISHAEDANVSSLLTKWICFKKFNLWTTIHNNLDSSIYRHLDFLHTKANKIITVSDELKIKYQNKFKTKNVKSILNPLDFSDISIKEEEKVNEKIEKFVGKSKLLLNIGRLSEQKNQTFLIEIFKEIRKKRDDVKLIIFGDGPKKQELQSLINTYSMQNDILLAGLTNNVFKYFKRCDMFVLSSRFEGFPMVLLEALSVGTTIISNDCPTGPREILANSVSLKVKKFEKVKYGYLVPFNNKQEFVKGINYILDNPNNEELLYRKRAKEFSVENIAKKWEKEFTKK